MGGWEGGGDPPLGRAAPYAAIGYHPNGMLTLYIVTAIIGGALILISAISGGHDADHDFDVGHDVDVSHDADVGHGDHGADVTSGAWLPFFSLRFWTYFAAAFGIIGLLLTLLKAADPTMTALLALGGGLITGMLVAWIMRWLKSASTTDGASIHELLGKQAKMLVGAKPDQMGKVRIEAKGEIIDMIAIADDGGAIEAGEEVLVVGVDGNQVRVARPKDFLRE